MAKDPAVLFYTSDFLTGTMTLSNEQIGKYIRLLCLQHQKGVLSEKDMINICGSHDEEVFCKFKKTRDGYYNERMRKEAEKRSRYSESRGNNRKKGADKQRDNNNHMKNTSNSYEHHMENENENENIERKGGGLLDFKNHRDTIFATYPKEFLAKIAQYNITGPMVYSTGFVNEPYQDLVDIIYQIFSDQDWQAGMVREYGEARVKEELSRFIRYLRTSQAYAVEKYRTPAEFTKHFVNAHLRKK